MALQYPLLFPYGERGFQLGIPYHENKTSHNKPTKRYMMTMHEYYKYQVHYRPNQPNPFLCYGRLSKQAIVDARAMEDEDRLAYIARNQDKLRCEYLQGVFDAIEKGLTESDQIGKKKLCSLRATQVANDMLYKITTMGSLFAVCMDLLTSL